MKKPVVLLATLFILPFLTAVGMVSPGAQSEAPVWLEVEIVKTDIQDTGEATKKVDATAKVVKAFKGADDLKAGDTIQIQYIYDRRPQYGPEGKRPIGPSSPPLLKQGRVTYAFLKPSEKKGVFEPGASAWSFAPPFGVPSAERAALGMKAPTPPSAPPPPPPNLQVPMKHPSPPGGKPPSAPPAPPSEAQGQADDGSTM